MDCMCVCVVSIAAPHIPIVSEENKQVDYEIRKVCCEIRSHCGDVSDLVELRVSLFDI